MIDALFDVTCSCASFILKRGISSSFVYLTTVLMQHVMILLVCQYGSILSLVAPGSFGMVVRIEKVSNKSKKSPDFM